MSCPSVCPPVCQLPACPPAARAQRPLVFEGRSTRRPPSRAREPPKNSPQEVHMLTRKVGRLFPGPAGRGAEVRDHLGPFFFVPKPSRQPSQLLRFRPSPRPSAPRRPLVDFVCGVLFILLGRASATIGHRLRPSVCPSVCQLPARLSPVHCDPP